MIFFILIRLFCSFLKVNKPAMANIKLLVHLFGIVLFKLKKKKKKYVWKLLWAVSSDRVWSVAQRSVRCLPQTKEGSIVNLAAPFSVQPEEDCSEQARCQQNPDQNTAQPSPAFVAHWKPGTKVLVIHPYSILFTTISPQQQPSKVPSHAGPGCGLFSQHW